MVWVGLFVAWVQNIGEVFKMEIWTTLLYKWILNFFLEGLVFLTIISGAVGLAKW